MSAVADANEARRLYQLLQPYFFALRGGGGYSTGTFAPTYEGLTTPGVWTYSEQTGFYTRIGNRCFFNLSLIAATRPNVPAGNGLISQLPFTSAATTGNYSPVTIDSIHAITLGATIVQLTARIPPNATYIEFLEVLGTAPTAAGFLVSTALSATAIMRVSGNYIVA